MPTPPPHTIKCHSSHSNACFSPGAGEKTIPIKKESAEVEGRNELDFQAHLNGSERRIPNVPREKKIQCDKDAVGDNEDCSNGRILGAVCPEDICQQESNVNSTRSNRHDNDGRNLENKKDTRQPLLTISSGNLTQRATSSSLCEQKSRAVLQKDESSGDATAIEHGDTEVEKREKTILKFGTDLGKAINSLKVINSHMDPAFNHNHSVKIKEESKVVLEDETIVVSQVTNLPSTDALLRTQIERAYQVLPEGVLQKTQAHVSERESVPPISLVKETIHAQLNIKSLDNAKIVVEIKNDELKIQLPHGQDYEAVFKDGAIADLRSSLEQKYPHLLLNISIAKESLLHNEPAFSSSPLIEQHDRENQEDEQPQQQRQDSHQDSMDEE